MNRVLKDVYQWKDRLLVDVGLSFLEALVVLLISYLYLIVLSINYGLDTRGVDFIGALLNTANSTLRPTEMITYVAGILSSTTAYFVVRLTVIKTHFKRILFILLFTAVLFWLATPLFIAGLQSGPVNESFAVGMAKIVGFGALGVWLFSLFSQRRVFEREITLEGNQRGEEIARKVGRF